MAKDRRVAAIEAAQIAAIDAEIDGILSTLNDDEIDLLVGDKADFEGLTDDDLFRLITEGPGAQSLADRVRELNWFYDWLESNRDAQRKEMGENGSKSRFTTH